MFMLPPDGPPVQGGKSSGILLWTACGAWSVAVQSLLFRQTQVLAGGWEPVLSVILSAWLAGAAAGTTLAAAIPGGVRLAAAVLAAAVAGPAALAAVRFLPALAPAAAGEAALVGLVPVAGVVAAVPGAAAGLLFAAAASHGAADVDARAARVYVAEAVGAAAGGALVLAGTMAGLPDSAVVVLSSAALAIAWLSGGGRPLAAAAVAVAGMAAAWTFPLADGPAVRSLWGLPPSSSVVSSTISPYGWTLVTAGDGQSELRCDGTVEAVDPPGPGIPWTVHPLAAAADPDGTVLLAGGEAWLPELLLHPFPRIEVASPDTGRIAAWRAASPSFAAALADPRVTLVPRDARAHLLAGGPRYGLILVHSEASISLAGNRLQTGEFFSAASRRLLPGGILALALPFSGETPSPAESFRSASVLAALRQALPSVGLVAGAGEILVTAGTSPAPGLLERQAVLSHRGIRTAAFRPEGLALLVNEVRSDAILGPVHEASDAPANRDATLAAGRAAFAGAAARLRPGWSATLLAGVRNPVACAGAGLLLCAAGLAQLLLRRTGGTSAFTLGAVGAFALVAETVLVYLFQARHGLLFSLVGVLIGAFMVGLAAGAAAGISPPARRLANPAVPVAGLLAAAAAVLVLAPRGLGSSLPSTLLLIAWVGFFDGLAFPVLVRAAGTGTSVGMYAAEVAGAAVGNLALSAFVLPLAGPLAATGAAALLLAAAALPTLIPRLRR